MSMNSRFESEWTGSCQWHCRRHFFMDTGAGFGYLSMQAIARSDHAADLPRYRSLRLFPGGFL